MPFHFSTWPVVGALLVVSTSDKKSIEKFVKFIVTSSESVAILVSILVPPSMFNVSVALSAVVDPSSPVTVANRFCDPADAFIVNVLPTIAVLIFVPPATVSVSLVDCAITLPLSASIVENKFCDPPPPVLFIVRVSPTISVVTFVPPATVSASADTSATVNPVSALNRVKTFTPAADAVMFQAVPSHFQVVVPSVNVSSISGLFGKFKAICVSSKYLPLYYSLKSYLWFVSVVFHIC